MNFNLIPIKQLDQLHKPYTWFIVFRCINVSLNPNQVMHKGIKAVAIYRHRCTHKSPYRVSIFVEADSKFQRVELLVQLQLHLALLRSVSCRCRFTVNPKLIRPRIIFEQNAQLPTNYDVISRWPGLYVTPVTDNFPRTLFLPSGIPQLTPSIMGYFSESVK